jgi:hypothetical protein
MARTVEKNDKNQEKVAVHSSKNLFKYGLGELKIGYNIVTKEASEFWITHQAVREATPEEVANVYIRSK